MLAGNCKIIFLVGRDKLSLTRVGYVVEDFYKASVDGGRDFSDTELSELEKIKKCPKLLESSTMLGEIRPYALPFFQKESLNSGRNLVNHGQKNNI